jgi:hypothetical protein
MRHGLSVAPAPLKRCPRSARRSSSESILQNGDVRAKRYCVTTAPSSGRDQACPVAPPRVTTTARQARCLSAGSSQAGPQPRSCRRGGSRRRQSPTALRSGGPARAIRALTCPGRRRERPQPHRARRAASPRRKADSGAPLQGWSASDSSGADPSAVGGCRPPGNPCRPTPTTRAPHRAGRPGLGGRRRGHAAIRSTAICPHDGHPQRPRTAAVTHAIAPPRHIDRRRCPGAAAQRAHRPDLALGAPIDTSSQSRDGEEGIAASLAISRQHTISAPDRTSVIRR